MLLSTLPTWTTLTLVALRRKCTWMTPLLLSQLLLVWEMFRWRLSGKRQTTASALVRNLCACFISDWWLIFLFISFLLLGWWAVDVRHCSNCRWMRFGRFGGYCADCLPDWKEARSSTWIPERLKSFRFTLGADSWLRWRHVQVLSIHTSDQFEPVPPGLWRK